MKVKSLLVGMMACVALGACTNQDLVEDEIGNGNNASTAKAYIGIKIADSTNGLSRAATDKEFDNGSDKEHIITKSLFLFYKDGVYKGEGKYTGAITTEDNNTDGTNIEANTTAVIVLEGKNANAGYPNQVVAFLNLPTDVENDLKGKGLDYAIETVRNRSDISNYATDENFIMTNSVFMKDGEVQVASPVKDENFAQTEDAAKRNPVTIYVERIAAKVTMTKSDELETPDIDINYNSESGYKLKLEIKGWGINGVNNSSYLLKNIKTDWSWNNFNWNDPNNSRSYWAKDGNYSNGTYPSSFDDYDTEEEITNSSLEYRSWKDVVEKNSPFEYCLENTMNATIANNINATTYMVIAGQYNVYKGTEKQELTGNLYEYMDRKIYTEEHLLALLANQANIYTKVNGEFVIVKPETYKLVRANLYDSKLELNKEGEYYDENENKFVDLAAVNKKLEELGTFTTFAQGKTFFYVNIEHLNTTTGEDGHIGIVRNHTYNLTLNSIKNLGNGVFDPDEDIIITPKEKKFYVGATLKILSWKIVNQEVNL